jgi:acyl-CoA dehydrogenase
MTRLWFFPLLLIILLVLLLCGYFLYALFVAIALFLPLVIPRFRQQMVIQSILAAFRQAMPPLSATEREALESGTVWWDGQLFSGKPDWQPFLDSTHHDLSDEEQAFLSGPTETLCDQLNDWEITHHHHDLPDTVWAFLKQECFFGLIIPKEYGGLGFSALAHSQMVMKVASRSLTAAVTVMVPNSLGPAELLLHYGTEDQKQYHLPRLARGEALPCFALTGPDAGSDASNLPDTGFVCQREFNGESTLGILLNWEKRYITLGPVATLLGLAFHLYDPEHLIGDIDDIGITLALIPTDTPGVEIGQRHWPMGMAFQNGPNWGKDVFIPLDWIIGGVEQAGKGWRMLMESLAAGRSISLPALSAGASKLACQTTSAYARIREQFHLPLGRFEGVADVLGRMAALTYMIDATRITTAQAVMEGERPAVLSAISKYHLTEMMRDIINDAMDIHGGKSICLGPRNPLAHAYQAIPISITVEGANILTRNLIIFGQGSVRAHPYLLQEIATLELDEADALMTFDRLLGRHLRYLIGNIGRSWFFSLSRGRGSAAPDSQLKHYYQQLNHLSAALAVATDVSLAVLGGNLKRKESLSARLGDVLSQLYLASCTLRHFESQHSEDDVPLAKWACTYAVYQAQAALLGLIDNLPNRPAAMCLRLILFPIGPRYKPPSDQLCHAISTLLLEPSAVRKRLINGIYQPQSPDDYLNQLEVALSCCVGADPIEKKVRGLSSRSIDAALENGDITDDEYRIVTSARAARNQVIAVDHFSADLDFSAPVNFTSTLKESAL